MLDLYKRSVTNQFVAALAMLHGCIAACPEGAASRAGDGRGELPPGDGTSCPPGALPVCASHHWDGIIGKYPFWQVAHHTLCFVDCYAATSNDAWRPHTDANGPAGAMQPLGLKELEEEYPSRRFIKSELLRYARHCVEVIRTSIDRETEESLRGPSGFPWLKFPRSEIHPYSMRHVQHHTGQLSAYLRRAGVDTRWVGTGWRE